MWLFLDTFHVLQHPTYASIFPPAHGATLALGQIVGHPWAGVLLSMALMTVAITWMLQGWLLPGGHCWMVLVILRIDIFSYWMESYWGGAVAATAGALVLGALPRIIKRHRTRDACWMALGAGLLVNSRPYEGLLFCLPVSIVILGWLFSHRSPALRITGPALLLPMIFILEPVWRLSLTTTGGSSAMPSSYPIPSTATNISTIGCSSGTSWAHLRDTRTPSSRHTLMAGCAVRINGMQKQSFLDSGNSFSGPY